MAESFFATLECELLDRTTLSTHAEARAAVFEFVEGWYNTRRRHSALGYVSPLEFERLLAQAAFTSTSTPRRQAPWTSCTSLLEPGSPAPTRVVTGRSSGNTRRERWPTDARLAFASRIAAARPAGSSRKRTRACWAAELLPAPLVAETVAALPDCAAYSHGALWKCPACGRPVGVVLNLKVGQAGAHSPLEISRATAADHACAGAARFPHFHSASSSIPTRKPRSPSTCHDVNPKALTRPRDRGNLS